MNDDRLENLVSRFNEFIGSEEEDRVLVWETGYLKYLRAVGLSARGVLTDHDRPINRN